MNLISLLEVDKQDCWFQKHGAMAHTANWIMQMLSEFFGGRTISRNLWPHRSPDLSPPNFYHWGFFRVNVYKNNPHTRRTETKHWAVHLKRRCRNSPPGCTKQEEKIECIHRWTRWIFPILNIALISCFLISNSFINWKIELVSEMGCVTFRSPYTTHRQPRLLYRTPLFADVMERLWYKIQNSVVYKWNLHFPTYMFFATNRAPTENFEQFVNKLYCIIDYLIYIHVSGVSRMTHSSDSCAIGLCVRNARVICRGKWLPPRVWYAAYCKHVCAFLKLNTSFKGLTVTLDAQNVSILL
jgi:hypothetical protein